MASSNAASLNSAHIFRRRRLPRARSLLLIAMVFHLSVCFAIFAAGRWKLLPSVFDSNGISRSFASDSFDYYNDAVGLVRIMKEEGPGVWFRSAFPFHTKLYSLSLIVFGPLLGFNVLAIEPLNVLCYATILYLVFKIGSKIFSENVGLISATIVAVWPTFLLHTTQILKDPMFIAAFLGFILLASQWMMRSLTFPKAVRAGIAGGALIIALWSIKPDSRPLLLIVVAGAALFQLAFVLTQRPIARWNLVAVSVVLACVVLVPRVARRYQNPNPHFVLTATGTGSNRQLSVSPPAPSSTGFTRMREQMAWTRYLYLSYPKTGSNIDEEIRFASWQDVFRYLPRAIQIGLFAPFPSMWISSGSQVGRTGRVLSGIETLFMYFVYALAMFALWKRRRFLPVWFLSTVAIISVTLLGLVVANVGALYRLRYPFWILLIVVAVSGATEWLSAQWPRRARLANKLVN